MAARHISITFMDGDTDEFVADAEKGAEIVMTDTYYAIDFGEGKEEICYPLTNIKMIINQQEA